MRRPSLLPLVPLYAAGLALREMRLERGWEKVRRLRYPVISIGNLSTGGSGKTPLTIALAKLLTARGSHVDVLSRGYGRRSALPLRVDLNGSAEEYGDEPLLIAREAGVPVYVAPERYDTGQLAEAEAFTESNTFTNRNELSAFNPDRDNVSGHDFSRAEKTLKGKGALAPDSPRVHILDDGFQHRQLARDIDILLINRADWHDSLLPAGNLREPLAAAKRAHVLAVPAEDPDFETKLRAWGWTGAIWSIRRRMEVPQIDGPVAAFCGIAKPDQFFVGLEAAGTRLALKKAFADHHPYTVRDIEGLIARARAAGATALITTEKDQIRLGQLAAEIPAGLPLKTAGLASEIRDESSALDWLSTRLAGSRAFVSL